jgi:pyruvate carboxylase subunit B
MLEVARAGADYLDVAMEPLAWGMVHPDVITIQAMLKDAGFLVPDINMKAYMEARSMTQSFIDDFLGYFIDGGNKHSSSLLVGCGLPGGMMGSMMADLKAMHSAINQSLRVQNKREVSLNELLLLLFKEVEHIWPLLGYPPLVTPFSQYVKNIALMNVMHMLKGEPRWTTIDKNAWDMILGKTGKLPGELAPEIKELVKSKGMEFYTGNPQDAYPNELEKYRVEMKENKWDLGKDDEELFEFAMHDRQYRDYKSGMAKKRFEAELEAEKVKANAPIIVSRPVVEMPKIDISAIQAKFPDAKAIQSPAKGRMLWEYDHINGSKEPNLGEKVKEGNVMAYIQSVYGIVPIYPNFNGKVIATYPKQGDFVEKGEIIAFVE